MAFTSHDVTTLETALATGALRVKHSDGREVTYHDAAALLRVLAAARADVAQASPSGFQRTTYAVFGRD
jgi:hypothetical protein